jgi:rod shape-determining protein MreD
VRLWLSLPLLALLALAQASLVPSLDVGGARADLMLVFVVGWAVVRGEGEALPLAILGGLLLDLVSTLPPGAHVVALSVVAFGTDLGHRFLRGGSNLFAAIAVVVASVVFDACLAAFAGFGADRAAWLDAMTARVLPGALYNLVLMVPALALLRAWDRRFPRPMVPEF